MSSNSDVGYGKPPKSTQFAKGRSGNPKGRPKGVRNLKTDLLEELQSKVVITEGGRRRTVTRQQALVKRLMGEALSGDKKAAALVLNLMSQLEGPASDGTTPRTPSAEEDRWILERFLARRRRSETSSEEEASHDPR